VKSLICKGFSGIFKHLSDSAFSSLKAVTRVRIPLGLPIKSRVYNDIAVSQPSERDQNVTLSFLTASLRH